MFLCYNIRCVKSSRKIIFFPFETTEYNKYCIKPNTLKTRGVHRCADYVRPFGLANNALNYIALFAVGVNHLGPDYSDECVSFIISFERVIYRTEPPGIGYLVPIVPRSTTIERRCGYCCKNNETNENPIRKSDSEGALSASDVWDGGNTISPGQSIVFREIYIS